MTAGSACECTRGSGAQQQREMLDSLLNLHIDVPAIYT